LAALDRRETVMWDRDQARFIGGFRSVDRA
jgi:hypothetical protein